MTATPLDRTDDHDDATTGIHMAGPAGPEQQDLLVPCPCGCGEMPGDGLTYAGATLREREQHRARASRRLAAEGRRRVAEQDRALQVLLDAGVPVDGPPDQLLDALRRHATLAAALTVILARTGAPLSEARSPEAVLTQIRAEHAAEMARQAADHASALAQHQATTNLMRQDLLRVRGDLDVALEALAAAQDATAAATGQAAQARAAAATADLALAAARDELGDLRERYTADAEATAAAHQALETQLHITERHAADLAGMLTAHYRVRGGSDSPDRTRSQPDRP